jgi:hypothetical protein
LKERERVRYTWREDDDEDVRSFWMTLRKREVLGIERGSTNSLSMEMWLWKRLWCCCKICYRMNE